MQKHSEAMSARPGPGAGLRISRLFTRFVDRFGLDTGRQAAQTGRLGWWEGEAGRAGPDIPTKAKYVAARLGGQPCRQNLAVGPGGQTWRPYLLVKPGGQTWRPSLAAKPYDRDQKEFSPRIHVADVSSCVAGAPAGSFI